MYRQLFGSINPHFLEKSYWILALEGELYEAPVAALVEGFRGGTPIYLIERHVLQMSPGVLSLGPPSTDGRLAGGFVGVGDPIYNRADSRWGGMRERKKSSTLRMLAGRSRSGSGQLSRLAASGKEIESCSRNWLRSRTEPILLRGGEASKTRIKEALSQKPSVLHLATHVVIPELEAGVGPAMIALSLNTAGEVDYLSATEIARMRIQVGLVVLNGCSSGTGAVLPGAGLMGLTRAWLAAGARAVIATRWPTPDHNGELFQALYSSMNEPARANHSFAAALQRAQLAQLRSGGWRAKPGYWSAYFCIERN
jgi:CHAT domain-containing protein